MSKLHWQKKRATRVREERRFIQRLISKEATALDWQRAMICPETIELLIGQLCPYRFAILGAVLIDKEVSESTNYMNLTAGLRGSSRDARQLRILFESRIKQKITQAMPQELIDKMRRVHAKKEAQAKAKKPEVNAPAKPGPGGPEAMSEAEQVRRDMS